MKNRKLILILSLVLALTMSLGGTLAYLTDTDADVNTMVLGNVKIEQHEYERVVDENGNWVKADEKYNATFGNDTYTPDKLQEFTQNKPLVPAVFQDGTIKWDDRNGSQNAAGTGSYQQPWTEIGAPGSNQLFDDSVKNVIDKFVFVENTGKTNAYFRTIIAIEAPESVAEKDLIGVNQNPNSRYDWNQNEAGNQYDADHLKHNMETIEGVMINGVRYDVKVAIHTEALPAGQWARPSLLQLYLKPEATNEDVAAFGDTLDVLVLTQAVQADGFAAVEGKSAAQVALETAWGPVTAEKAAEWLGDVLTAEPEEVQPDANNVYEIATANQLFGFAKMVNEGKNSFAGKTVKLTADINLANQKWEPIGQTGATQFQGTFDGNGYTIYNLFVDSSEQTGKHYSSGLFGWLEGKSNISNVNINGAKIVGHHNTGVIAGYAYANITNCTVTGAEVINTHANDDACGDKAGVIVGYAGDGVFSGNSAHNCTVTAGRDAGQLFGCAIKSQLHNHKNNTATNVVVKATGDCPEEANIKNEPYGRIP